MLIFVGCSANNVMITFNCRRGNVLILNQNNQLVIKALLGLCLDNASLKL